ncbi:MAG: hypothetical protein NVSMB9_14140 [Isosphaeraceae bacterium]
MNEAGDQPRDSERVLVLAPTRRDAAMTHSLLTEARIECVLCPDPETTCREIANGCGALLLTEESLHAQEFSRLVEILGTQPTWSDLPVLVLARGGADSALAARAIDTLGNVIVLEQPVRISTLVSGLRMALRARRRQYQIRAHLEDLREVDRRKDEFLAMLAHELRNPLASVNSAVRLLRTDDAPDHLDWALGVLERQIRHLSRLIEDLLDISRITRGTIVLRKEIVDAAVILDRAIEDVRPLIQERRQELTVSFQHGSLWLEADPTRLEQVFVNVLANAAKYTQPCGRIQISAAREEGHNVIRVQDNGVGIPPSQIPRMFELFAQGDRSIARSEGGLGIGLTLVKALVESHLGTVTAFSEGEGRGSLFVLRLPAVSPPASEPVKVPATRARGVTIGRRVLVVDDNIDTVKGMAKLLKILGHEVWTAQSGPEAITVAKEQCPEVILLDLGLPVMDGYEVAASLRKEKDLTEMVIIAVSGYGQEQDRRRAREAGIDHHFVKPVDYDALIPLLDKRETLP